MVMGNLNGVFLGNLRQLSREFDRQQPDGRVKVHCVDEASLVERLVRGHMKLRRRDRGGSDVSAATSEDFDVDDQQQDGTAGIKDAPSGGGGGSGDAQRPAGTAQRPAGTDESQSTVAGALELHDTATSAD